MLYSTISSYKRQDDEVESQHACIPRHYDCGFLTVYFACQLLCLKQSRISGWWACLHHHKSIHHNCVQQSWSVRWSKYLCCDFLVKRRLKRGSYSQNNSQTAKSWSKRTLLRFLQSTLTFFSLQVTLSYATSHHYLFMRRQIITWEVPEDTI